MRRASHLLSLILAMALFVAAAPAALAGAAGGASPAAGPDNDGWLEARVALLPLDDPGRFDLAVSDSAGALVAEAGNLGDGGGTGAVSVTPGLYRVAVAGSGDTSLGLYISTIACLDEAGHGPVLASCAGCTELDGIPVASDAAVVCTVTLVNAQPPLAVAVAQFDAACQGETPLLSWVTEQEVDIQGFYLYRGASPAAPDTQLTPSLIPAAAPGSTLGAGYSWVDGSAAPETVYAYWLEVIALDGASELLPPVTVTCLAPTAVRLAQFAADEPAAQSLAGWGVAVLVALALSLALGVARRRSLT